VSGNIEPGEQKSKATAGDSGNGSVGTGKTVGFPLGFRPENVRCYDETATTLCNGTRPGFTTGVIQPLCIEMTSTKNTIIENGISPTLTARMGTGGNQVNAVVCPDSVRHIVRRLTPLECERLQGFPDGWTDIGEWTDSKGKKRKVSDAARYKALGNSIAIPPWKWVLKRLCACYERDATMASLFDGIGGFPYIWEHLNGVGSCLWASEIEEFPMAVTKLRFGDNDHGETQNSW
jgi:DNA (cytosine-5)-methyltransferase 1